jgi:hypothetical protein
LTPLEFDIPFLLSRFKLSAPQNPSWGAVSDPPYPLLADKLAYMLGPKLRRTPGEYPAPPEGTTRNEFYHHSVVERVSGREDGYIRGRKVVNVLKKAGYTEMEREMAIKAGLATLEQVKTYWEVEEKK